MRHLTADELVDLAEGVRGQPPVPHLASCAACRAQLADLQSMMARVADVEVPEPSPLFWNQFSARVRDAVAAESRRSRFAVLPSPRYALAALACAALAIVAVTLSVWFRGAVVGVPSIPREIPVATEAIDVTLVPPDDPTLDVVADLGAGLDWQQVHDAGVVAHTGLVDRAVSGLSADERAELGKLLKQQLRGGGN